jgi:hypothetical protein
LRFSKPKNSRFEDQIETLPYSLQGVVLARYPRSDVLDLFKENLTIISSTPTSLASAKRKALTEANAFP